MKPQNKIYSIKNKFKGGRLCLGQMEQFDKKENYINNKYSGFQSNTDINNNLISKNAPSVNNTSIYSIKTNLSKQKNNIENEHIPVSLSLNFPYQKKLSNKIQDDNNDFIYNLKTLHKMKYNQYNNKYPTKNKPQYREYTEVYNSAKYQDNNSYYYPLNLDRKKISKSPLFGRECQDKNNYFVPYKKMSINSNLLDNNECNNINNQDRYVNQNFRKSSSSDINYKCPKYKETINSKNLNFYSPYEDEVDTIPSHYKYYSMPRKLIRKYTKVYDPNKNNNGYLIKSSSVILSEDKNSISNDNNSHKMKKRLSNILLSSNETEYTNKYNIKTSLNLRSEKSPSMYETQKRSFSQPPLGQNDFLLRARQILSYKGAEHNLIYKKAKINRGGIVNLDLDKKGIHCGVKYSSKKPKSNYLIHDNKKVEEAIIIIQKWWRKIKQALNKNIGKIIRIQSFFRGKLVRKNFSDLLYLNYLYIIFCKKIKKIFCAHLMPFVFDKLNKCKNNNAKLNNRNNINNAKLNKIDNNKLVMLKRIICKNNDKVMRNHFNKWFLLLNMNNNRENIGIKILNLKRDIESKCNQLLIYFNKWKYNYQVNKIESDKILTTFKINALNKIISSTKIYIQKTIFRNLIKNLNYLKDDLRKKKLTNIFNKNDISTQNNQKNNFDIWNSKTFNSKNSEKNEEEIKLNQIRAKIFCRLIRDIINKTKEKYLRIFFMNFSSYKNLNNFQKNENEIIKSCGGKVSSNKKEKKEFISNKKKGSKLTCCVYNDQELDNKNISKKKKFDEKINSSNKKKSKFDSSKKKFKNETNSNYINSTNNKTKKEKKLKISVNESDNISDIEMEAKINKKFNKLFNTCQNKQIDSKSDQKEKSGYPKNYKDKNNSKIEIKRNNLFPEKDKKINKENKSIAYNEKKFQTIEPYKYVLQDRKYEYYKVLTENAKAKDKKKSFINISQKKDKKNSTIKKQKRPNSSLNIYNNNTSRILNTEKNKSKGNKFTENKKERRFSLKNMFMPREKPVDNNIQYPRKVLIDYVDKNKSEILPNNHYNIEKNLLSSEKKKKKSKLVPENKNKKNLNIDKNKKGKNKNNNKKIYENKLNNELNFVYGKDDEEGIIMNDINDNDNNYNKDINIQNDDEINTNNCYDIYKNKQLEPYDKIGNYINNLDKYQNNQREMNIPLYGKYGNLPSETGKEGKKSNISKKGGQVLKNLDKSNNLYKEKYLFDEDGKKIEDIKKYKERIIQNEDNSKFIYYIRNNYSNDNFSEKAKFKTKELHSTSNINSKKYSNTCKQKQNEYIPNIKKNKVITQYRNVDKKKFSLQNEVPIPSYAKYTKMNESKIMSTASMREKEEKNELIRKKMSKAINLIEEKKKLLLLKKFYQWKIVIKRMIYDYNARIIQKFMGKKLKELKIKRIKKFLENLLRKYVFGKFVNFVKIFIFQKIIIRFLFHVLKRYIKKKCLIMNVNEDLLIINNNLKEQGKKIFYNNILKVHVFANINKLFGLIIKLRQYKDKLKKKDFIFKLYDKSLKKKYSYGKLLSNESISYSKKLSFSSQKSDSKQKVLLTHKYNYKSLLEPFINYLQIKINEQKATIFEKIKNNYKMDKLFSILSRYLDQMQLVNKKYFIDILKKIYSIDKLYILLRKKSIRIIFSDNKKIGKILKLMILLKITYIQKEIMMKRFARMILRKWRFINFTKSVSKKKLTLLYKNFHMSYLEIVKDLFSDEELNNPSIIKEFERFGTNIGMWDNEKPNLEDKLGKEMKDSLNYTKSNISNDKNKNSKERLLNDNIKNVKIGKNDS